MNNPMADGSIGTLHGEMKNLVRNPFRSPFMRENYDAAIKTYDEKHRNFIYESGRRCLGNAWASFFWRGFDGATLNWDSYSKNTASYAMYRAGKDIAAICEKQKDA